MATFKEKVEDYGKKHPELSWSAYEQNAEELHKVDTEAYWKEVYHQAIADLDSKGGAIRQGRIHPSRWW